MTRQYGRRAATDFSNADVEHKYRSLENIQSNNFLYEIVGRNHNKQSGHHECDNNNVVDGYKFRHLPIQLVDYGRIRMFIGSKCEK